MENKSVKNKFTLVILGRSGSGKGTQAKFILDTLGRSNALHLETGYFLRETLVKYKSLTTEIGRREMARGRIFPAWFSAAIWLKLVIEKGIANKHWIFDGPRWLWEIKLIDEVAEWHGRSLSLCVYIHISKEEAEKRLRARGRDDDNNKAIKNRMDFFEKNVMPSIRYFKKQGRFIHVDGSLSPDRVRMDIDRILRQKMKSLWPR